MPRSPRIAFLSCAAALALACSPAADPVSVDVPPAASPAETTTAIDRDGCGGIASWVPDLSSNDLEEAKISVGAIARGAVGAYERAIYSAQGKSGAEPLCGSVPPLPSAVPRCGARVDVPESAFHDGSGDEQGWRCLRFAVTEPTAWRYGYIRGGPYRGLDRGAQAPGPNGFQVFAERDYDGDGKTALLILSGTVDEQTKSVQLAEIFESDPDE